MRMIELFCGSQTVADCFKDQGFVTHTVDIEDSLTGRPPTIRADLSDPGQVKSLIDRFQGMKIDFIWASPPCEKFSVANSSRYHFVNKKPVTQEAEAALALVQNTLSIIEALEPTYWMLENPRGFLRHQKMMKRFPRVCVRYCNYGLDMEKPTDIWGRFPQSWNPKTICYHARRHPGGRGEENDVFNRKMTTAQRAIVPEALAEEVVESSIVSQGVSSWQTLGEWL